MSNNLFAEINPQEESTLSGGYCGGCYTRHYPPYEKPHQPQPDDEYVYKIPDTSPRRRCRSEFKWVGK